MSHSQIRLSEIDADEPAAMRELLAIFASAFEEESTLASKQADDDYLSDLLAKPEFIALSAYDGQQVVGGLTAYELRQYSQPGSELYLYDLAVAAAYRRRGIATRLIRRLREIAAERGCSLVFVQADYEDRHAISLYEKLGKKAQVFHFELEPIHGTKAE